MDENRRANLANWNDRVPIHWDSDEYDVRAFTDDPERISGPVRFDCDASELGEVSGKSLLHLQCHIGTDTLSWARLGAVVTGLDFSEPAVEAARRLSAESGAPGRFVVSELYDAPAALPGEQFDIVYTGVGALCWLPDIRGWARIVAGFLAPGGSLYVRDGHPVIGCFDFAVVDDRYQVRYPYFEAAGASVESDDSTYAGSSKVAHPRTVEFSHGLAETIMALVHAGLGLDFVHEHKCCDWMALDNLEQGDDGRWRLPAGKEHDLPLMFSIKASKPA